MGYLRTYSVPQEDSQLKHTVTVDLFGKQVSFETGKWAKQANGSVVVRQAGKQ